MLAAFRRKSTNPRISKRGKSEEHVPALVHRVQDGNSFGRVRIHRFEVNGGSEEHDHGDGVEHALEQPDRDHGAHGNIFFLGDVGGTNEFAGTAHEENGS